MRYQLGIDFGTTYTAAAVHRAGRAEIVPLGNRAAAVPSVLFLRADDTILTGEAAARRAVTEANRVARGFKRRIGDPTPLVVGGTPYAAEALTAKLLRWVVDLVTEREGGPPARIAISHPANWGAFKQDFLSQAVRMAELGEVTMLTEPEAAAISYASNERVEIGDVVAVYDLGGGTFDAAVLRKIEAGFEVLGAPEGIEHLGGIDFDEAVLVHVDQALDGALEQLDPTDPIAVAAVARLRQECVDAKEALSSDTETSIPVILPNLQAAVRLVRGEFEAMIRPALASTIAALRRALRSARLEPEQISTVLLVGGSSRIPLVAQMVSSALERPVAVDAHPKHAIALGAALAAGQCEASPPAGRPVPHVPTPRIPRPAPERVGVRGTVPGEQDGRRSDPAPQPERAPAEAGLLTGAGSGGVASAGVSGPVVAVPPLSPSRPESWKPAPWPAPAATDTAAVLPPVAGELNEPRVGALRVLRIAIGVSALVLAAILLVRSLDPVSLFSG